MTLSTPKAIATGVLRIGAAEVDCFVLDTGDCFISQRSIIRVLIGGPEKGDLGRYVARLPARYAGLTADPVSTFTMPQGGTAKGRPAQWFVDLLRAYDEADDAGELHTQQRHLAKQARVILRALAGVGLVALVHEATGYQAIRAQNELQCRLNALLLPTPAEWQRMWPEPIVASLCKTFRIRREHAAIPAPLMGVIGGIYGAVLGSEVHAEVKRRNPRRANRDKHHQFFGDGLRQLTNRDLDIVKILSDQSANKREFWARLNAHYRNHPLQLGLEIAR